MLASDAMIEGSSPIGTVKSCSIEMLKPRKSLGATPMMVSGTPSALIVRPTTLGSAPKCRCQKFHPSTATGAPVGTDRSTSAG